MDKIIFNNPLNEIEVFTKGQIPGFEGYTLRGKIFRWPAEFTSFTGSPIVFNYNMRAFVLVNEKYFKNASRNSLSSLPDYTFFGTTYDEYIKQASSWFYNEFKEGFENYNKTLESRSSESKAAKAKYSKHQDKFNDFNSTAEKFIENRFKQNEPLEIPAEEIKIIRSDNINKAIVEKKEIILVHLDFLFDSIDAIGEESDFSQNDTYSRIHAYLGLNFSTLFKINYFMSGTSIYLSLVYFFNNLIRSTKSDYVDINELITLLSVIANLSAEWIITNTISESYLSKLDDFKSSMNPGIAENFRLGQ